ncbi:hypothetical protein PsorP6_015842 [Peronosclerospora sorghi]|uniref:Uncharacterized protein n=1 Tax=Peronosclerospora sorghi TaxID=230839 RepID=A0ACC0WN05_9STRA|nr:hypothetical protein PsorP6_015842 [Peronosclerospora sorghi]
MLYQSYEYHKWKVLLRVLHDFHYSAVGSHPGIQRTFSAIRQYFWWPSMLEHIALYVGTCESCVRHKSGHRRRAGLLQSLPVPEYCWQHVTMDFVTALPPRDGFDAVYVVEIDAKTTARLFFDNVVRYYSLTESIVSDRDPRFTSEFWQELMTIMQVKVRMTVSRRSQANVRSERQYAHATLVSTSSRVSPFEVDCGRKSRSPMLLPAAVTSATAAGNFTRDRQRVVEFAQTNMRKAQERQAHYYNQGRRVVEFRVGDMVYVDARALSTELGQPDYDPDRDPTHNKPFEVEQRISNNAYRLKLPRRYVDRGRHPTFNVDQLKLSPDVPEIFRFREITCSAPRMFDNEGQRVYEIKELLQQRRRSGQRQWLCFGVDLPVEQNSWKFESDIHHVSHWDILIQRYRERKAIKRRSLRGRARN